MLVLTILSVIIMEDDVFQLFTVLHTTLPLSVIQQHHVCLSPTLQEYVVQSIIQHVSQFKTILRAIFIKTNNQRLECEIMILIHHQI